MFSKRIRIRILIKGRFWRGGSIYIYIYVYIKRRHPEPALSPREALSHGCGGAALRSRREDARRSRAAKYPNVGYYNRALKASPRFPLKGFSKGDVDIGVDIDVDMDVDSDMAVSMSLGSFKEGYSAALPGFCVDISHINSKPALYQGVFCGCPYVLRALLFGCYIRARDDWQLPYGFYIRNRNDGFGNMLCIWILGPLGWHGGHPIAQRPGVLGLLGL